MTLSCVCLRVCRLIVSIHFRIVFVQIWLGGVPLSTLVAVESPHTLLSFLSPAVEGGPLSFRMTVGAQIASVATPYTTVRIAAPSVTALEVELRPGFPPLVCLPETPPTGNTIVHVFGVNFGAGGNTTATLDGVPLLVFNASEASLSFTTGACTGELVVTTSGQASAAFPYNYNPLSLPPQISNVVPLAGWTEGNTAVNFTGLYFRSNGSVYFVDPVTDTSTECLWRGIPGMYYTETAVLYVANVVFPCVCHRMR